MNSNSGHLPKPLTEARVALAQCALQMLVAVLLGLVGRSRNPNRPMLRRLVNRAERFLESLIMVMAVLRVRPPKTGRHPGRAGAGFKLRPRAALKRACVRGLGLRIRGDLRARLRHLQAALADPAPYVARLTKRLLRGIRSAHLIPVAPPRLAFVADAEALTPAGADSS